jgi:hypothetical protein
MFETLDTIFCFFGEREVNALLGASKAISVTVTKSQNLTNFTQEALAVPLEAYIIFSSIADFQLGEQLSDSYGCRNKLEARPRAMTALQDDSFDKPR